MPDKMRSLFSFRENRKGQVGNLAPAVIALVIASLFLILGLVMIQSVRNTDIVDAVNKGAIGNETLTTVNEQGDTVAGATSVGFNSFVVSIITNINGTIIPASNYTASSNGVITYNTGQANAGFFNNSFWNVTYTYAYGDTAFTVANKTITGIGTFADFWTIIVLAIVISVVIGLLLTVFGGKKQR